jgi:copper transport protein
MMTEVRKTPPSRFGKGAGGLGPLLPVGLGPPLFRALLFAFLLSLLPLAAVFAHANLVSSIPADGSALTSAPSLITLQFSENLDASFSAVSLLNSQGLVVVPGPGTILSGSPRTITLSLPPLPDGVYSAAWKTRSAEDGHVANGAVSFSVGKATPRVSLLPPPGAPEPATALPSSLDFLLRWLGYLAAAVSGGSVCFGLLVFRPAFRSGLAIDADMEARATRWLVKLARTGALGLGVVTLAYLVYQSIEAGGGPFLGSLGKILTGRTGWIDVGRVVLLAALWVLVSRLPSVGRSRPLAWAGAVVLNAGVLLTFSLQSHAVAAGGAGLPVGVDWIHLVAVSAWIGGLLPLAILTHGKNPLPGLVPYFSRMALVCVGLIGLTGLYSSLIHIDSLAALTGTTYGRAVILKVTLYLILVGLGAINLLILSPRMAQSIPSGLRWLGRTVPVEMTLAVIILLAAGVLSSSAPARDAMQAQQSLGILETGSSNGVDIKLRILPGYTGDDEFGVDVTDHRAGAAQVPAQVLLRFTMLDQNMGVTQAEAVLQSGTRYTVRGSYLSMAGNWHLEVIVRRSGFDDATYTFSLPALANVPGLVEPSNPVPATAGSIATGQALFQKNCVACHGLLGKGDGPVGRTLFPPPADLTAHAVQGLHTDWQLYNWITNGYPGSQMPAFSTLLTDIQRWDLVNFIRTLAK